MLEGVSGVFRSQYISSDEVHNNERVEGSAIVQNMKTGALK